MYSTQKPFARAVMLVFMLFILSACGGAADSNDSQSNAGTAKTTAIEKIEAFARDANNPAPTVQDYIDAGVTGVTSENLVQLNSVVSDLTPADVDTTEELNTLANSINEAPLPSNPNPSTPTNQPPTVDAGANLNTQVNEIVTVVGSGADSDGTVTFVWKKGDTVLATSASFNYTPTVVGTDTLTLYVTDNNGITVSDSMNVMVTTVSTPPTPANVPPTANAGDNKTVQVNQSITITGIGTDSDGTVSYEWRNDTIVLSTDASFSYTPTELGTHTLTLFVTDDDSAVASASMNVTVIPVPDTTAPIITLNGSTAVEAIKGSIYYESGATASDNKDGDITANITIAGDTVNTQTSLGSTFTITYNVADTDGNSAIEVTRTVSIIADPNPTYVIPPLSVADITTYLTLINNARGTARTCGGGNYPAVPAVTWSDKIYRMAYEHSQDMSNSNLFSHAGSGTESDWSRASAGSPSHFTGRAISYNYSGIRSENIAAGVSTAESVMNLWLGSPGHCANIMSPNVNQVGLALSIKSGTQYTHYWTQNFGYSN